MDFHENLKTKVDTYAHSVYDITKNFPKGELFGITSQLRRSSLSVALNYIEGFARMRHKVHINFLEISYGSLKESQYLVEFSYKEKFISEEDFKKISALGNEIGAMLWRTIEKMK